MKFYVIGCGGPSGGPAEAGRKKTGGQRAMRCPPDLYNYLIHGLFGKVTHLGIDAPLLLRQAFVVVVAPLGVGLGGGKQL